MTDSNCHSTERHRKVGHLLPFASIILLLTMKRMKSDEEWALWCCVSVQLFTEIHHLMSTGHQQNFYALHLIFFICMLIFQSISTFALLLRIIWIKIVLKNHTRETKIFLLFSSSKKNCMWKSWDFCLKPEPHFTPPHSSSHGSNFWWFQDSSETYIFSDIVFYLFKGFEICLFCQKERYLK